ncbi:MAG: hypothetical protein KIS85_06025 [Anaerolineales bacterium]|nr:hypothetical protein [Anaerolineales bacterium]
MNAKISLSLLLLAGLLVACAPATAEPTSPPEEPVVITVMVTVAPSPDPDPEPDPEPDPDPEPVGAYPWPRGATACVLQGEENGQLYMRPHREARVFADLGPGFNTVVVVRTWDGWVGFDPGITQAANFGVFRLRWAHFDDVLLSGDCVSVPQVNWVPRPEQCYAMPMANVTVYTSPNITASVRGTLEVGEFAGVLGLTTNGWAQLDLSDGNSRFSGIGWMEQSQLNMNGSTCDELPTVRP